MFIKRMMYGLMAIAAFYVSQNAYAITCVGANAQTIAEMGNVPDRGGIGASLGTYTATPVGTPWTANCAPGGAADPLIFIRTGGFGADPQILLPSAANNRYGFRVRYNGAVVTTSSRITVGSISGSGRQTYTQGGTFTVEVIKLRNDGTGITPGLVLLGQAKFTNNSVGYNVYARISSIAAPTCTVNTGSVTIPLGNVAGSSFGSVGSVSTTSAAQNIALSCTSSPRVNMTLQGTQAAGGPNTTVALTGAGGAGVAQGIGVQILYGGNPLVVNSTTPTVVSTAAGASLNVPVNARYYRIGAVVAGRANASPTLRFDYN